jgi:tubulin polyglutamylase TTLL4
MYRLSKQRLVLQRWDINLGHNVSSSGILLSVSKNSVTDLKVVLDPGFTSILLLMFALKHQGDAATTKTGTIDTGIDEDLVDDGVGDDEGPDEDEESPYRDPPEGCVRLRPSQFHGIPSTVFAEYPRELGIRRDDLSVVEPLGSRKLCYKSHWERICIKNAHCRAGFEKSEKFWTSLWSKHQNSDQMKELNCLQKVNHFPASWCIGRKDRLTRTLNTMKRVLGANGNVYDFHPETFILPAERESLHRLLKTEISCAMSVNSSSSGSKRVPKTFNSSNTATALAGGMWIVKPVASSCGQGIKVMTGQQAAALPKRKKAVVQRYLAKPYLIDGRKFDLRIYVLVAGVDPLRVYIHDEGLTRISTAKYTTKNLTNSFAHLTNYSINKNAPNFKAAAFNSAGDGDVGELDAGCDMQEDSNLGEACTDPEMEGFKWSLAAFRRWLSQREGRAVMEQTFDRIFDLCLKTMIAAESEITPQLHSSAQFRTNCYELFGCDVILDSALQPHLLEVNVSPSLMGSSPLDKKIKGMVIADTLHIVGMYPHDPALLRKYDQGANSSNAGSGKHSFKSIAAATITPAANPFAFSSLSKLMNSQDRYRRDPCPESIDIAALGDTDASWMLLLMAEDELQRARSSKYHCVHPTASNASYYSGLYRSCRFSDHLLAHWVIAGGAAGRYRNLIPAKFRPHQSAVASPQKSLSTKSSAVALLVGDGQSSRGRAKSAGRTGRVSTYVPAAMLADPAGFSKGPKSPVSALQAEAAGALGMVRSASLTPRGGAIRAATAGALPLDSSSSGGMGGEGRRSRADRLTAADADGEQQSHRHRGHSEPKHLGRSSGAIAEGGLGSPVATTSSAGVNAPSSALRARLEQGINRAAAYYGDQGSGSPQQRLTVQLPSDAEVADYDGTAGLHSADATSPHARVLQLMSERGAQSPHTAFAKYLLQAGGAVAQQQPNSAELTRRLQEATIGTLRIPSQVQVRPYPSGSVAEGAARERPSSRGTGRAGAPLPSNSNTSSNGQAAARSEHSDYVLSAHDPVYPLPFSSTSSRPSSGTYRQGASGSTSARGRTLTVEKGLAITGSGDSKKLVASHDRNTAPHRAGALQSLSPLPRTPSAGSNLSASAASSSGAASPRSSKGPSPVPAQGRSEGARATAATASAAAASNTASPQKHRRLVRTGTDGSGGSGAGVGDELMRQVQRTLMVAPPPPGSEWKGVAHP